MAWPRLRIKRLRYVTPGDPSWGVHYDIRWMGACYARAHSLAHAIDIVLLYNATRTLLPSVRKGSPLAATS